MSNFFKQGWSDTIRKEVYIKLSAIYHPDKDTGDEEIFKRMSAEYNGKPYENKLFQEDYKQPQYSKYSKPEVTWDNAVIYKGKFKGSLIKTFIHMSWLIWAIDESPKETGVQVLREPELTFAKKRLEELRQFNKNK
jgi:hypothetical protein